MSISGSCHEPMVENGQVSGHGAGTVSWSGRVRCDPGYSQVGGNSVLKCVGGVWSGETPVCVIIGDCADHDLVGVEHGWVTRLGGYRGGVRRFHCNRGFTLSGADMAWCDQESVWRYGRHNNVPTCVSNNPVSSTTMSPIMGNTEEETEMSNENINKATKSLENHPKVKDEFNDTSIIGLSQSNIISPSLVLIITIYATLC